MARSTISRFSKLATDPLRSFRFLADFRVTSEAAFSDKIVNGFRGGFTSISGLSIQTQSIGYREGGMNTTLHQVPGMTQFQPISFQRGAIYGQDEAITWMRGLFAASAGEGIALNGNTFRCDIDIYVLDHPVAEPTGPGDEIGESEKKMKFTVHNAWITSVSFSDLNAGDNQLMYENMTVVHEGLSVTYL